ncbi:hypothetical protein C8A05DRAFT_17579 [Staphylotrichum tortipilum]|uniref:Rhodopsin domain-containing protein n=1 Tax=Staphylotrichum tortipilum TaxID=2831512 RepID=A0AAN6RQU9_9PEZI|nr:hypothetical protein C8A05DRAFT_17579 [Staphylotrichum longicolle]
MSDAQSSPTGPPQPALPHDSLKPNIIIACALCWWIAAFFVGLRFYTRGVIIRVLGWSDWSILLALIFSGATCAGVIEQAIHGAGHHVWDLDPNDFASAIAWGRAAWYGILFYLLSLAFSKLAILLLYIHLFTFKWARVAGQVLFGIVVVSHLYMALVTFTACIPLNSYWDFTVPKKYCHPQSVWWSNTGLHMVTDFLIFLLPMPVVWTIKLPRRQKLILSAVFGFGFIVCFISILRLLQLLHAQTDPDFTYAAAFLSYLTAVEINGAIVCACVMTLKPLLSRFWPRFLGSLGSSRSRSGYPHHQYRGRNGAAGGKNNRRASDTLVGGPPTIGSLPSKRQLQWKGAVGALDSVDREVVWVDGGYVEIDDGDGGDPWGADVELAENVGGRGEGVVEGGVVRVDTEVTVEVSKVEK